MEVAPLIEHAVIGQVNLAVDHLDGSVGEHGGGVVDVLGPLGEPDEGDRAVSVGGELGER